MSGRFISLDMDETLLCSLPKKYCLNGLRCPDGEIPYFKNGEFEPSFVFRRPGIEDLLEKLATIGTLNVFTCGMRDYAHQALTVTGLIRRFDRIFTREDCIYNARRLSDSELAYWKCSRDQAGMRKDLRLV